MGGFGAKNYTDGVSTYLIVFRHDHIIYLLHILRPALNKIGLLGEFNSNQTDILNKRWKFKLNKRPI